VKRLLGFVALALAAGCSSGGVGTLPAQTTTSASTFRLGFAVGTARIADPYHSAVGLNVVATFRAPGGQDATLANTPTLSGPANFNGSNSVSGALPTDVAAAANSAHPSPPPGAFGELIGVFGYGFAPLNLVDATTNAIVYSNACQGDFLRGVGTFNELPLPLDYNTCASTDPFESWQWYGGPPAWPSPVGYGIPVGFSGYPFGFMDFDDVAPAPGQYTLTVQWLDNPAGTQYDSASAVANLSSAPALPAMPAPSLTVNNDGSGTLLVNVPHGVKEAIIDIGTTYCYTPPSPLQDGVLHYYSVVTKQTGPQSLTLTNDLGPPDASGKPTHTFCTASDEASPGYNHIPQTYELAAVGFDYPAYEASYPQSTAVQPVIANSAGQADITEFTSATGVAYSPGAGAAARRRR
jgi:hypothetical protein